MSLIVFGTSMIRKGLVKLRGLRHGVTKVFYKTLKKREKKGNY